MNDDHQDESLPLKPSKWTAVGIFAGVVALWAASGVLLFERIDRGEIGDMFGAINALFSGLAFAGVVYTIMLQRNELELQRRDLALTRKEMAASRVAQEAQAIAQNINIELSVLNTLVQESILKEERLAEKARLGAYNIDGRSVSTLIAEADNERKAYIARLKELIANRVQSP